jgi:hypothetical protein
MLALYLLQLAITVALGMMMIAVFGDGSAGQSVRRCIASMKSLIA